MSYTHLNFDDVKNAAPDLGLPDGFEMRFATVDLEASATGCALSRYAPDQHTGFGHRHDAAEEVYFVLAGSGRVKLDDDIVELSARDAIRVAPEVWRSFAAGPEGMEVLAFGAHHPGDGAADPNWWPADG